MGGFVTRLLTEGADLLTFWLLVFVFAIAVVQRVLARAEHRGIRVLLGLAGLHVLCVVLAVVARGPSVDVAHEARLAARLTTAWVAVLGIGSLFFEVLLPRMRVRVNRIIEDLFVFGALAMASVLVLRRAGVDVTGLVATSAVVTAVIGLSLQDTLGNTIGGLALQLDDSIHVGDWVKIGDVNGRVVDIRWRFTAVETRNWETVYVPNSRIVKSDVVVFGQRRGQPQQWRRWVWFNVDFRTSPGEVIEAVTSSLVGASIPNVAADPAPNCVLMDLGESTARYAVRYWLTDLAVDDPTDGAVRARIFFALKRKGIPLAIPAHALFMTEDTQKRRERQQTAAQQRRIDALHRVEIFAPLDESERERISEALTYAPFGAGETVTRQGNEAHWLYLVAHGEVAVRVAVDGDEREVTRLGPGEVFGEMSLLTGERRAASVVALTDVECWRLDRDVFRDVLRERPDVAKPIADLLAARRVQLDEVRGDLDAAARGRRLEQESSDLLHRMRAFFGL
jgi:small-conductance mechanosensitive channel/CRP-like cAMP-binding protein